MNTSTYIGLGLALLGSNLCLLLLLLNGLSWINFLHMDLTPIENFAESIELSPEGFQIYFQSAAVGWLISMAIFSKHGGPKLEAGTEEADKKNKRSLHHIAFPVIAILATLALPHILESHQHRHPIIRRSVVLDSSSKTNIAIKEGSHATSAQDAGDSNVKSTTENVQQELVFSVEKMTCGGCGSHVRNLAEADLAMQQKKLPADTGVTIDKVQVDWRAGVMSVHGMNVVDYVDQQAVAAVLEKDGYPTSFLYSQ